MGIRSLSIIIVLALCTGSGVADRLVDTERGYRHLLVAERENISQGHAAQIAKHHAEGSRVLGAKRKGGTYRVKVLMPSGRVKVLMIDAETGQVVR